MMKTIAVIILLMELGIAPASAQQTVGAGILPVAIVLVDDLPFANASAVLIRRNEMKPETVVLVTRRTSPADLTRAMGVLFNSRRNKGDHVSGNMVAPIAPDRSFRRSKDYPQAVADLAKLAAAPPRFIEGVGSRPVIFSHLRPAPRKSAR
jgi:hypothetical protein